MCSACGDTGYVRRTNLTWHAGKGMREHEWYEPCICRILARVVEDGRRGANVLYLKRPTVAQERK